VEWSLSDTVNSLM